jgi:hypothetical protein
MQEPGARPAAATGELRVQRIVIVDGNGKEVGWIDGHPDGATIRLGGVRVGDGVSPQILLHTASLPGPNAVVSLQQDPSTWTANAAVLELANGTASCKTYNAEGDLLQMQSAAHKTGRGVAVRRKAGASEQLWPD